ncbi:hypothetical protein GGF37_005772 [Kickxella alabastrina]|nr:hypothetical protein GGF37_005772 [Kickxella alabastrina]
MSSIILDHSDLATADNGQALAQRRETRHQYRSLLSDATTRQKEYLAGDGTLLLEDLARANQLFDGVKSTAEGILDSRFLILSADISAQRAHQLRIDSAAFDPLEFIDQVRMVLYPSGAGAGAGDSEEQPGDWAKVGTLAMRFGRMPPRFSCLYGPLMTEKKVRKRIEVSRKKNTQREGPVHEAQIDTMGESDIKKQENQTTKLVQKVHRLLTKVGPINLFQFVINPHSFSQSVENIFYVSFLIRDGKAYIDDQTGQPMIEACEPPQHADYEMGLTRKQLIFSLDQNTWTEIINVYGIAESTIPMRPSNVGADGLTQMSSQALRH